MCQAEAATIHNRQAVGYACSHAAMIAMQHCSSSSLTCRPTGAQPESVAAVGVTVRSAFRASSDSRRCSSSGSSPADVRQKRLRRLTVAMQGRKDCHCCWTGQVEH